MPEFLLLLRDNPADFQGWTPEDLQRCVESYRAWSEKLLAENKIAISPIHSSVAMFRRSTVVLFFQQSRS